MNPPIPSVPFKVLIIEDYDLFLDMLRGIIVPKCTNAEIDIATTVAEAHAFLDKGAYDLVLSDYDLPDGDAVKVFEKAKVTCPNAVRTLSSGRVASLPGDLIHDSMPKPWKLHTLVGYLNGGFVQKRPAA
jgi:DNA-binding NtrC family response regulator